MVNENIESVGLNRNVQTRALKFYYIGKNAGLTDAKLKELALIYKNQMENWNKELYKPCVEKLVDLMKIELKE